MRIHYSIKGVYKKSPKAEKELKLYGKECKRILNWLSKQFDFKLPDTIILRPLYSTRGRWGYHGRANCYMIALNLPALRRESPEGIMDVLFHEASHVAEYWKFGKLGHSKTFKNILDSQAYYTPKYI
jgi:predicted SprT family Zn-dependent metalloprotease